MSDVFRSVYAATYDTLYRDKNYRRECEVVLQLLREHAEHATTSILDLGCGTGNHAICFAELGFDVVGVDRSAAMLDLARAKAGDRPNLELRQGDIRRLDLDRRFDAAVMLFAVIGYQTADDDVVATLSTARRHLRPGGLLVFDAWYGPAVLHNRPETRSSRIQLEQGELVRTAIPQLEPRRQLCRVRYELRRLEGEVVVESEEEEHVMRFFFPKDLQLLLDRSGLSMLRLSTFPEVGRDPDETTWNFVAVARAV